MAVDFELRYRESIGLCWYKPSCRFHIYYYFYRFPIYLLMKEPLFRKFHTTYILLPLPQKKNMNFNFLNSTAPPSIFKKLKLIFSRVPETVQFSLYSLIIRKEPFSEDWLPVGGRVVAWPRYLHASFGSCLSTCIPGRPRSPAPQQNSSPISGFTLQGDSTIIHAEFRARLFTKKSKELPLIILKGIIDYK